MPQTESRCLPPHTTRHRDWLSNEPSAHGKYGLAHFAHQHFMGEVIILFQANKGCFRVSKMENGHQKTHTLPARPGVCS